MLNQPPSFIAIAGGNASGKSSLAAEVAHLLGVHQIVGTDAVREVVREYESSIDDPFLHASSFRAWKVLGIEPTEDNRKELVQAGFQLHRQQVVHGVRAILKRFSREGTSAIIEGIHLSPSIFRSYAANTLYCYIGFPEARLQLERFVKRSKTNPRRQHGGLPEETYHAMWDIAEFMQDEVRRSSHRWTLQLDASQAVNENARLVKDEIERILLELRKNDAHDRKQDEQVGENDE